MGLRLFVAVSLTPKARQALTAALEPLRATAPSGLRWVAPEGWHFTLQFLGSVDPALVSSLRFGLATAATGQAPFELALGGGGAFPSDRRARVLWVGATRGGEALGQLASRVVKETGRLGFVAEERAYHAHLTVGRLRRPAAVTRIVEAMRFPEIRQSVDELVLYRSHLEPSGARYEALHRVPLEP